MLETTVRFNIAAADFMIARIHHRDDGLPRQATLALDLVPGESRAPRAPAA